MRRRRSRGVTGTLTIADLMPLAHRPQSEHSDDCHATGGHHRADEQPKTCCQSAVSGALHIDKCVSDDTTGNAAKENTDEGNSPRCSGRKCRHTTIILTHIRHATAATSGMPDASCVVSATPESMVGEP